MEYAAFIMIYKIKDILKKENVGLHSWTECRTQVDACSILTSELRIEDAQ